MNTGVSAIAELARRWPRRSARSRPGRRPSPRCGTSAARRPGGRAATGPRWRIRRSRRRTSAPRSTAAAGRRTAARAARAPCRRHRPRSGRRSPAPWAIQMPPRSRISASSATATPPVAGAPRCGRRRRGCAGTARGSTRRSAGAARCASISPACAQAAAEQRSARPARRWRSSATSSSLHLRAPRRELRRDDATRTRA